MAKVQTSTRPKGRQIGGGGEYNSLDFQKFLKDKEISHQITISHTLQQNGIVEFKNKTL